MSPLESYEFNLNFRGGKYLVFQNWNCGGNLSSDVIFLKGDLFAPTHAPVSTYLC